MRTNKKGFTLIELIVVIAILAILAAIAIPTFSGITDSADERVELANARSIATAYNAYAALHPDETLGAVADEQGKLVTAGLWPSGIDPKDLGDSLALVRIENGVAIAGVAPAAE